MDTQRAEHTEEACPLRRRGPASAHRPSDHGKALQGSLALSSQGARAPCENAVNAWPGPAPALGPLRGEEDGRGRQPGSWERQHAKPSFSEAGGEVQGLGEAGASSQPRNEPHTQGINKSQ